MALSSSDSMAQEVSRGPGTFIHPSSPHHLHCFHGIQLPDNFRDDDEDFRSRRVWWKIMAKFKRPCNVKVAAPINGPIRRSVPWSCGSY